MLRTLLGGRGGRLMLVVAALALLLSMGATAPADARARPLAESAGDSIVGDWEVSGGVVRVTGSGGSYIGVVTRAIALAGSCTHPVGQQMWTISGTGPAYTGTHIGFNTADCSDLPMAATWELASDGLRYCTQYGCATWTRQAASDARPPTVAVAPVAGVIRLNRGFDVRFSVKDDSGRAKPTLTLYSDGSVVSRQTTSGYVKANGADLVFAVAAPVNQPGPFYVCVEAVDPSGNASAGSPTSACRWLSIQVRLPLVSNGCGGAQWGQWAASAQNWVLNEQTYGGVTVSIRKACNLHDAGYSGATVADPFLGRIVDFRTWSRARVDDQFFHDIQALCQQALVGKPALVMRQCMVGPTLTAAEALTHTAGAAAYYHGVRKEAHDAYDANATLPGVQTQMPASTVPPGGARQNG